MQPFPKESSLLQYPASNVNTHRAAKTHTSAIAIRHVDTFVVFVMLTAPSKPFRPFNTVSYSSSILVRLAQYVGGTGATFTLHVSDTDLPVLHEKLALTRLPDGLDGAGWGYGVPLAHVKRLVVRWKAGFDWRKSEEEINKLPQFTRDIPVEGFGTLSIHYLHQRSKLENAIPLLFVHGWPGHFLEVRKLLPGLVYPSFHVVALSLPGFGFSEAPKKKGFASRQYAEVANKLMLSLGYNEYVAQGGDWGHEITGFLSTYYGPTHVKGWLSNNTDALPPTLSAHPWLYIKHLLTPHSERERKGIAYTSALKKTGSGYFIEQATKPQTIGYSLADSPAGLLAWIYEKLFLWTDEYPWDDDEVLEWVSIYWFSRTGPAVSLRIYKEMTGSRSHDSILGVRAPVPFGYSAFPKELIQSPRTWLHTLGNVVCEREHERGGHFAAHEQPEALVKDFQDMFGKGGSAFGVVPGRNGYA
ncbi:epoxide hydrolase [Dichomitus squalens]|nr:epoxide hydrolase [Dichomitus squalens]